jgi:hypothetical protein
MLGYLERNAALDTAWVVVDDDPAHYPAGVRIIAIDPHQGFDARAAAELGGTLHDLVRREARRELPSPASAGEG